MIFIISGATCSGKGTVITGALQSGKFNLARGMNVTTREHEARDEAEPHYQYVSEKGFKKMIKRGELLEYDYHHRKFYGTNRIIVEKLLKSQNVIMEADYKGAFEIKDKMPNVILIYIMVDLTIIRKRIIKRGSETEKEIRIRIGRAAAENKQAKDYNYVVENPEGHPEIAINEVLDIIDKELKKNRS
ncbi:MAG: hypothetical protein NTW06_03480 [Candidatus Falkowbacteria bacterium]|nr:hypothetical protein [Candidatus Falkowbacteria bacterium]